MWLEADHMSLPSDKYEQFIASLIDNVKGTHRNISDIEWGRTNTITGVCGQPHQIDVSFVDHDFDYPTLVIIECKRYMGNPIKLEHVKVVKATMDDILAAKDTQSHANAIIVTTVGAQEGAQLFADYYGIIIESVPHGPNYTFRYENIIQASVTMSIKASVSLTDTLRRKCQLCDEQFEVQDNENVCPICSSNSA